MAKDKVIYGLKNVHVSAITETTEGTVTTYTFGAPQSLPGAKTLSITPEGESTEFYADDTCYWEGDSNSGYSGTLEVANIPDWFKTSYLGYTVSGAKEIVEKADATPSRFAMLFEFEGDVNGKRYILYNCRASRPEVASETTEASTTPGTQSLSFRAIALGAAKVIKAETTKGNTSTSDDSTNFNTWFTAAPVYPTF